MSLWDAIKQKLRLDNGFQVEDLGFWLSQNPGSGGGALSDITMPKAGPALPSDQNTVSTAFSEVQRGIFTYGISRPLTTAMLLLDNEDSADQLDPAGDPLSNAWNASEYVSPGQAIVAGFNRGQLGSLGDQGAESPRNQVNRAIVQRDRLDASDVGGAFKNNSWANLVSGVSDAGFQFGLDPLSAAGKGAGKVREATMTRTLTDKTAGKLRAEVVSRRGGLATAIDEMPESFEGVMASPLVKQSADPEAFGSAMYLAGKVAKESADEAETMYSLRSKVVLAATGDQRAIDELRENRAVLADQLDTLTGNVPKDPSPGLFDDLVLRDKWLAASLGEMDNAGAVNALVNRPTASRFSVWESNKAKRSEAMGRLNVGDDAAYFGERTFQLGPGARSVRSLHWMGQTRPSGAIRVDGLAADGYRDVQSAAMRVRGWTPEVRAEWGERWAMASTVSERSKVAMDFRRATVRQVVEEHGLIGKEADDFTNALLGAQQRVADDFRRTGYLMDGDEIVTDAMLATQLRDSVPLIDLDHLYRVMPDTAAMVKRRSAAGNTARSVRRTGSQVVESMNNVVDLFWRPLVLMRGGYAPRNTAEAWGRMAATGVLGRVAREQGADGVANFLANRVAGVKALGAKAWYGADSAEFGAAKRAVTDGKRVAGTGKLKLPGGVTADDARAGAGGRELAVEASSKGTIGASLRPGDAIGGGRPTVPADGSLPGSGIAAGGWSEFRLDPADVDDVEAATKYFDGYTRVVNKQFMGDPIAKQVLEGRSRAEIKQWVASNKQYGLRREYGLSKAEAQARVDTIANYVDEVVPDDLRPQILSTGGLSPQEYREALEAFDLPPIHVQNIEQATIGKSRELADSWRAITRGVFKFIGQMPEDNLVRNPYVTNAYRRNMETYARLAVRDGIDVTDDVVLGWQRQARKAALKDLKDQIYTIDRYSNAAASLRTISPFIAATNNTVRTWAKIIGKNPQAVARANQLWNSPLRAGLVVQTDEDGGYQRVNSNSPGMPISSAYGMVIPVPKAIKDRFGVPEQFELVPPLSSMNVALQSDPVWLPGWGPMVTVPFGWFANREPTNFVVERFGGFIFPQNGDTSRMQSPPDPWKAALPAYIRQAFNKEDPDGSQRTSIFAMIAANEMRKAMESGDYSFFDAGGEWVQRIEEQTDAYFTLRMIGAGTLPFASNLQDPEGQFYVSQFRQEQRAGTINGVTATERFIQSYGEAFRGYTFSASRNNTGVAADTQVQRRVDALDPALKDALGALNPQLLGALVNNPDGSYNFSSPTLNLQKSETTGPTGNVPFREAQTGAEAFNRTQVAAGWEDYIASRQQLDAWMRQNNVSSLQRVPQLQAAWQAYVADLSEKNPAWAKEYAQRDTGTYQRNVQGFELIFQQDPNVAQSRPELALVQDYITSRQQLQTFLASPQAPARTLTAQANEQLRSAWEAYVRDLLNRDERFADLYFQFFDGEFGRVETPGGF